MKYIHFPTLALHVALLVLAKRIMNDYADAFLGLGCIALLCHLIWYARNRRPSFPSHLIGSVLQFAAHGCGWILADSGAFGLGGGGFAQFFYLIALGVSLVIEGILALIRKVKSQRGCKETYRDS